MQVMAFVADMRKRRSFGYIRGFPRRGCHAPWLLIEAGLTKGLKATSYKSIKTDMVNAGARWEDSEVVVHRAIITSRNPDNLEAFSAKILEALAEHRGSKRTAV